MTTTEAHIPAGAGETATVVGQSSAVPLYLHQSPGNPIHHQHRKVPHRHLATYPWERPGRLHANRTPGPTLSRRGVAPSPSSSTSTSVIRRRVSSVKSLPRLQSPKPRSRGRRQRRSPSVSEIETGGVYTVDSIHSSFPEDHCRSRNANKATGITACSSGNIDPRDSGEFNAFSGIERDGDGNHDKNNNNSKKPDDRRILENRHTCPPGSRDYETAVQNNNAGEISRHTEECNLPFHNQNGKPNTPRTPAINIQTILEHCESSKRDSLRSLASQQVDSEQLLKDSVASKGGNKTQEGGKFISKEVSTAPQRKAAVTAAKDMIKGDGEAGGAGGEALASPSTAEANSLTWPDHEKESQKQRDAIGFTMNTGSAESERTLLSMRSCPGGIEEVSDHHAQKPPRYHRKKKKKSSSSEKRGPPRKENIWSRLSAEAQHAMTQTMKAMELNDEEFRDESDSQTQQNMQKARELNQNSSLVQDEKGQYHNQSAKLRTVRENLAETDIQNPDADGNAKANANANELGLTKDPLNANVDSVQKNMQNKRRHKSETESNTSGETPVTPQHRTLAAGNKGRQKKNTARTHGQVVHWRDLNEENNNNSRKKSARTKLPKIGSKLEFPARPRGGDSSEFAQDSDDYYYNELAMRDRGLSARGTLDDEYGHSLRRQHSIPGVGSFTVPRYNSREKTFEITPVGYDSRYEYTHTYNPQEDDPVNPKAFKHSVKKCSDWLNKCLPADDPNVDGAKLKLTQSSHF